MSELENYHYTKQMNKIWTLQFLWLSRYFNNNLMGPKEEKSEDQ